ncbi:Nn.00g030630.m01.CDS01 [Neocucurbitaria sp. VM-36]
MAKLPSQAKKGAAANPTSLGVKSSKVKKPAQKVKKTKDMATPKAPRKPNTAIFGNDAPSAQLRMPQDADITAAELIAFLPNWLRSYDVVYRFAQNGMDTATLSNILNYHRTSTKGYAMINNSLCKVIQNTMRDSGYEGWTVKKHKAGLYEREDEAWDERSLSLTGFELSSGASERKRVGRPVENVAFASLANDIERYPEETTGDGLNLTRCVMYAVANPQYALEFPRDFIYLTQLTGGPSGARRMHRDSAVFSRWRMSKTDAIAKANNDPTGFVAQNYVFSAAQHANVLNYLSQFGMNQQPAPVAILPASNDDQGTAESDDFDIVEFINSLTGVPVIPADFQGHGISQQPVNDPAPALQDELSWMDHGFATDYGFPLRSGRMQQEQHPLNDRLMGGYVINHEFDHGSFGGYGTNIRAQHNVNMQTRDRGSLLDPFSSFAGTPIPLQRSSSITGTRLFDTAGPSTAIDWGSYNGSSNYGNLHDQDPNGFLHSAPERPRGPPSLLHHRRSGFENGYAGYQPQ